MTYNLKGIALAASLALTAGTAQAASDFSFTGYFTGDADVVQFSFTVDTPSTVTLRSYSYAGGTMADGTVVAAGGFDPILSLSRGNYFLKEIFGGPLPVPEDPVTELALDAHYSTVLSAGTYTLMLSQFGNFSDWFYGEFFGFTESSPTFTAEYGCSQGRFCAYDGINRTGFWAIDLIGVESATQVSVVPLPATAPLLLAGLAALGLRRRSRNRQR